MCVECLPSLVDGALEHLLKVVRRGQLAGEPVEGHGAAFTLSLRCRLRANTGSELAHDQRDGEVHSKQQRIFKVRDPEGVNRGRKKKSHSNALIVAATKVGPRPTVEPNTTTVRRKISAVACAPITGENRKAASVTADTIPAAMRYWDQLDSTRIRQGDFGR